MTLPPERRKFVALSSLLICGMIVCACFAFRHTPHQHGFRDTFDLLMLANFALIAKFNWNRPQPDTLTHLFPPPASPAAKETPNS